MFNYSGCLHINNNTFYTIEISSNKVSIKASHAENRFICKRGKKRGNICQDNIKTAYFKCVDAKTI